jgi:hypothetical protein
MREAMDVPIAAVTHAGFVRVVLTNCCKETMSEQEAWSQTKDYGSVVALDAGVVAQETQL